MTIWQTGISCIKTAVSFYMITGMTTAVKRNSYPNSRKIITNPKKVSLPLLALKPMMKLLPKEKKPKKSIPNTKSFKNQKRKSPNPKMNTMERPKTQSQRKVATNQDSTISEDFWLVHWLKSYSRPELTEFQTENTKFWNLVNLFQFTRANS